MNFWKWFLLFVLTLSGPLLAPSPSFARETEAEILESPLTKDAQVLQILSRYPKIRIFVDEAPGNGHQAAGVLLLKRIRQIGYAGKIEMVYDDKKVEPKLEFLLPPFRSGQGTQVLPEFNVMVTDWYNRPTDPIDLAITAGSEFPPKPEELHVRHLVSIHPSNWKNVPSIRSRGDLRIQFPDVKMNHPLVAHVPRVDDLSDFVEKQMANAPRLKAKTPGLIHLLRHIENHDFDLLSAYGVGVGAESKINALTRSLIEARTRYPNEFDKPIVVGLLSNVNVYEWAAIMRDFAPNEKTRSPDLRARVAVLNLVDPDFAERLTHLSADQITFVNIGPVSQDLWYFMMDQSTLPPTAAGANGLSFLLQRGKPFLNTSELSWLEDDSPEGAALIPAIRKTTKQFTNGGTQAVLDLLMASRNPESATSRLFRDYANHLKTQPDRVCETLLQAAPHFDQ